MKVYKDHSNTTSQMDDLLKEARQEKPVMNLKEVENIVRTGHYSPVGTPVKGFHVGINTAIVMSGIVVSSFLAYMVLRVDKQREELTPPVVTSVPEQNKKELIVLSSEIRTSPTPEPINVKLTQQKEQPKIKTDKFLASADKNLIVPDKPVENLNSSERAPESVAELSDKTEVPELPMRKVLSGEFMITFNYNDQEIKMKLIGDDITGLSIDDRFVAAENYDNYSEMISEGKSYLAGNHEQERNNLDLIRFFDDQLQADKVIADDSRYTFELTSSQLLINKVPQSNEVFSKYKKLYEAKTGKIITSGSTYRFERSAQSE